MKTKSQKIRFAAYFTVLMLMIAYPVYQIISFEYPAVPPREYRFVVDMRDPYDPMRGRYIRLSLSTSRNIPADKPENGKFVSNACLYAVLKKNKQGYAEFERVYQNKKNIPPNRDYLKCRGNIWKDQKYCASLYRIPFQNFYLNEKLAPEAEEVLRNATGKNKKAVIVVNVYQNGNIAVRDLLIHQTPIRQYLRSKKN